MRVLLAVIIVTEQPVQASIHLFFFCSFSANDCLHLWEFLRDQLNMEDSAAKCMEWTNKETGEFRLIKTGVVAKRWGESKNRTSMTYEKMARAMRYYYKMNILEKVPHKRLHFRFGKTMLPKVVPSTA